MIGYFSNKVLEINIEDYFTVCDEPVEDEPADDMEAMINKLCQPTISDNDVIFFPRTNIQMAVWGNLEFAIQNKIDLTLVYSDWIMILGLLKKNFAFEDARKLFHKVSEFYPRYTHEECDETFMNFNASRYKYSTKRLDDLVSACKEAMEKKKQSKK